MRHGRKQCLNTQIPFRQHSFVIERGFCFFVAFMQWCSYSIIIYLSFVWGYALEYTAVSSDGKFNGLLSRWVIVGARFLRCLVWLGAIGWLFRSIIRFGSVCWRFRCIFRFYAVSRGFWSNFCVSGICSGSGWIISCCAGGSGRCVSDACSSPDSFGG